MYPPIVRSVTIIDHPQCRSHQTTVMYPPIIRFIAFIDHHLGNFSADCRDVSSDSISSGDRAVSSDNTVYGDSCPSSSPPSAN